LQPARLILWTGPKHSGKTTAAGVLVDKVKKQGFAVAGLLAPAIYSGGALLGFEVVDLKTNSTASLAEKNLDENGKGAFGFDRAGLNLGSDALSIDKAGCAELIVVDEFGPLELKGRMWRKNVDELLSSTDAVILLVVRDELIEKVESLYKNIPSVELPALDEQSAFEVIKLLRQLRRESK